MGEGLISVFYGVVDEGCDVLERMWWDYVGRGAVVGGVFPRIPVRRGNVNCVINLCTEKKKTPMYFDRANIPTSMNHA